MFQIKIGLLGMARCIGPICLLCISSTSERGESGKHHFAVPQRLTLFTTKTFEDHLQRHYLFRIHCYPSNKDIPDIATAIPEQYLWGVEWRRRCRSLLKQAEASP